MRLWIGFSVRLPQLQKAWPHGSTSDLSLTMLVVLTTGLCSGYGLLRSDWIIVVANSVGAALSPSLLAFKIRGVRSRD